MTVSPNSYMAFLSEVESALTDALESGRLALEQEKRDELRSMRQEVAAVRKAMLERLDAPARPLAAVR